jgi:hypothetical protein
MMIVMRLRKSRCRLLGTGDRNPGLQSKNLRFRERFFNEDEVAQGDKNFSNQKWMVSILP